MFKLIKNMFIGLLIVCTIGSLSESLFSNSKGPIKFVYLNNYLCHATPPVININSEEALFHSFPVSFNKYGGSCNTIDDPHVRVCVPNKV